MHTMPVHPYHLVQISPWPILMSFAIFNFALILISWLTHQTLNLLTLSAPILISFLLILWFRDIIREAQGGYHTKRVQRGILISFLLFLLTEIALFFSFFWAFFHSSLAPAIELGCEWPPVGLRAISTFALPLFGTTLLLSSGMTLTLGHHAVIQGNKPLALFGIFITAFLGLVFAYAQYTEYQFAEFTISDSIFGNVFFSLTGLHGLHVIAGCIFLIISGLRLAFDNYTSEHHLGLEFSIIYFHLVDIVWVLVYLILYWWAN